MRHSHLFRAVVTSALTGMFVLALRASAAAQTVGLTQSSPSTVPAGVSTQVTVTSAITDPNLLPSSIVLQRLDANGTVVTIGTMLDDGLNGDAALGDRIFTLRFIVNEAAPGELRYRVSAGFRGSLRRSMSEPFSIFIRGADRPEQLLPQVAQELANGDIDAALTHFSLSPLNGDSLRALTAAQRQLFATALNSAVLIRTTSDMRVFQTPWTTPGGKLLHLKIVVAQTPTGEWQIVSW